MTFTISRRSLGLALAATVALTGIPAMAQDTWQPEGPVRILMHTKPGGTADIFIRTLAATLEPAIGQPLVVENLPGAGGANQMNQIRRAEPDGLTLGINTVSHFTGMLTNLKGVFAPDNFSWIAAAQIDPILLFSSTESDIDTIEDLVALAKERGDGVVNIGGFGPVGSMQHIGISMFEKSAGIKLNWVAFEATPDILTALLGGHVDVGVSNLGPTLPFFESDRLEALAILGPDRLESLPDTPTVNEAGYPVNTDWVQVRGLFGPADMDPALQTQIADAFQLAMQAESYQDYAAKSGVETPDMGPEDYSAFVQQLMTVAEENLREQNLLN
ncbi:tripartite tricarboxylate transporter substrate binding protein [Paracoccus gahaiensis]|uniref:Tripartite tricarboxylate transporter substrate binding protein n=1 Tax=Paracoccus gahaiensis TaxID=1706839 RepID=A0A4U0R7J4_9RHOB|nr:tripartite tricarboxylate transporter substrate binding protein [Paracoccus gahaiensis]TJZ90917.1 tripartite tricarboxylate transporter substrate binding protein [Paracoccus gahaiensis]